MQKSKQEKLKKKTINLGNKLNMQSLEKIKNLMINS